MKRTIPRRARLAVAAVALTFGCAYASPALAQRDAGFRWLEVAKPAAADAGDARLSDALRDASPGKASSAEQDRIRWWKVGGPAYRWNEIAVDTLIDQFVTMPLAARHLALVQTAVDDAVRAALVDRASPTAAASLAASTVLQYLFPARAATFTALADECIRLGVLSGSDSATSATRGAAIGRRVGDAAVARGKADGSDAKWAGAVPTESGRWTGSNPIAPAAGQWKTWMLASNDEFRPPAPPAVDSDRTKADLEELRKYQRTPMSNHRATYWEVYGGARVYAYWNDMARTKLLEYGEVYDAAAATRILAMLNVALNDAAIACWEAKYAYWYPRPGMLDKEFKTVFATPNHPSYPSAHACISAAAAGVLEAAFPRDRGMIGARANEASEARLWAGIHYRFDLDAGNELGRRVAQRVLSRAGWTA
jgi:hypothetical protein